MDCRSLWRTPTPTPTPSGWWEGWLSPNYGGISTHCLNINIWKILIFKTIFIDILCRDPKFKNIKNTAHSTIQNPIHCGLWIGWSSREWRANVSAFAANIGSKTNGSNLSLASVLGLKEVFQSIIYPSFSSFVTRKTFFLARASTPSMTWSHDQIIRPKIAVFVFKKLATPL